MQNLLKRGLLALVGWSALAGAATAQSQTVMIRGGRVITMAGDDLPEGDVLVRDGVIAAVGPKLDVPYDASVVDAKGKVVFPGMILAHTSRGLDRANERVPVAPFLDVYDAIDPSSLIYEEALRDGVTAINVMQGNDTVVAGIGRVVRPLGLSVEAMTVKPSSAIKIAVAGKSGYDRVQQRAHLREVFAELDDVLDAIAEARYEEVEKEAGRHVTIPPAEAREKGRALIRDRDVDEQHRRLFQLIQGRLDVIMSLPEARDVAFGIALAKEHGFLARTTFVLGGECVKAVEFLKEAGRPVLLPLDLTYREDDPETGVEHETPIAKVIADAGIPFALQTSPQASFAEKYLWYQAARCVRQGVDRQTALEAITVVPARIIGLENRLGSVQAGHDADLLLLSGDPLAIDTQVESVLIGGRVVYERAKDPRLSKLLPPPAVEEDDQAPKDEGEQAKKSPFGDDDEDPFGDDDEDEDAELLESDGGAGDGE